MTIKNTSLAVVGLCLAFTIISSRADVLLSNPNASLSVSETATLNDGFTAPFTVDSFSDYEISAIKLAFIIPDVIGATGLIGEIRTSNSGTPRKISI